DLLTHYPAFQINFYNTLSTFAQNTKQQLWQIRRTTEEERFRAFLQRRSLRPAGKKTLHIRMEDLAVELGVTRLRVSQMLARLASQGKLTTSRGVIEIPALETL
ncbi:MAG: Crp/Fnr family transcriptional regulator, partial [Prevotellamassilia sp.]